MINGKKPMPKKIQKGVDEIEKMTFKQVIEERQVFPAKDDEFDDLDGYEVVFNILADFYNITVSQWRKVKWAAKKLEALC